MAGLLPERSIAEQLAGYTTLVLGGHAYHVPVLARRPSRAWKALFDERIGTALASFDKLDSPAAILAALNSADDAPYELVRAYDESSAIPPDDELEGDTDGEWMAALLVVYRAAHPTLDLVLGAIRAAGPEPTTTPGPEHSNGRRRPTAGGRATSKTS